MTLKLSADWLWDFWFGRDGDDYHIFYLHAPRSLGDPKLRHWNVSIGHAVSEDLFRWEVLPDALAPSPTPAWDDYTTWTGSILRHNGLWHFFYTGTNRAEKGLIQRVGLATSNDLICWEKHPANPIIEADPRWYELLDLDAWHDLAWRDPWVFWQEDAFYALITGRVNHGPADGRGVIALAHSTDLIHWEVQPPLTDPGEFGQMEVPQLAEIHGRWYIFFNVTKNEFSVARLARSGVKRQTGTHYLVADHPLGPYTFHSDEFFAGDELGSRYSGKVIQNPQGEWVYMAFKLFAEDGQFVGELDAPRPINIASDGILSLLSSPDTFYIGAQTNRVPFNK